MSAQLLTEFVDITSQQHVISISIHLHTSGSHARSVCTPPPLLPTPTLVIWVRIIRRNGEIVGKVVENIGGIRSGRNLGIERRVAIRIISIIYIGRRKDSSPWRPIRG